AEHHADEGKNGDDGDEAVLAARAQIAKRQHALDGRKGARRAYGVGGHARLVTSLILIPAIGRREGNASYPSCARPPQPPATIRMASSMGTEERSPVARRFTSTCP